MRRIEQGSRTWNRRLIELARVYLNLVPCEHCGSPAVWGYVCMWCRKDEVDDEN